MESTAGRASRPQAAVATAVILFGPPGSGKGTQAKLLQTCMNATHISTGDILRHHIQSGDAIGQEVRAIMDAGLLVPDELVNHLVEHTLAETNGGRGVILDGYPRTLAQAKVLEGMLERRGFRPLVVYLKVDYNEIISRLCGRRLCPLCGTLYNVFTNPPKVDEICDLDGTGLVTRPDDTESVIRHRLEEYEFQTRPLLDYFRASTIAYREVDAGAGTPESIASEICGLVARDR